MMALYDSSDISSRLYYIRVNGALRQDTDISKLSGFLLKYTDELLANQLPLSFRIRDSFYFVEEPLLRVHPYEFQVVF